MNALERQGIVWPVATLGQNLQRLRLAAGFETQVAFGRALGVGSQAVSDWENDRRQTVDLATVLQWAKVLKRPVEDFVVGLDADYDALRLTSRVTKAGTDGGSKEGATHADVVADLREQVRELEETLGTVMADFKAAINKVASGQRKSTPRRRR